jgi:hypothetical protein
MSRDLLIAMLRKGQTGNEIMQILDAIISSEDAQEDVEDNTEV